MIDFYVNSLVGSSLQRTNDLKRVRDALGISASRLDDPVIDGLQGFFRARNQIVHQLDYERQDGVGGRHTPVMADVRSECDDVFALLVTLVTEAAVCVRAARRSLR